MIPKSFIKTPGVYYKEVLNDFPKSGNALQPLFEAFTNSLEAIHLRKDQSTLGIITIKLFTWKTTDEEQRTFERLVIEDNGIGFDEENFDRLQRYKDSRKGFDNRGTGRLQIIKNFDKAQYVSVYKDTNDSFQEITFTLSATEDYLRNDSIIYFDGIKPVSAQQPITTLTLIGPLNREKEYGQLTAESIKAKLIDKYMLYFCSHRDNLPQIKIEQYSNDGLVSEAKILPPDIPPIDKTKPFFIQYQRMVASGLERTERDEEFIITAFKISAERLDENAVKLTSKKEIVDSPKIRLHLLNPKDKYAEHRFLFLISSKFLDEKDGDNRGKLNIRTKKEYLKQEQLFTEEHIFLEDIEETVNSALTEMYDEILNAKDDRDREVQRLKSMFLLSDEIMSKLKINLGDSEEKILSKAYEAEAKTTAKLDAEIKEKIDRLEHIDTSSPKYQTDFDAVINELVKTIPLQNRTAITHYIARRKLVLELFQKILDRQLALQRTGADADRDEKLLHNLIFQQHSKDPSQSDLWLINEDFIYFKGSSELQLRMVEVDGRRLMKSELSPEEEKFRKSLGEDRLQKRPDILLFPSEGKCIIIEVKSPDVNVSDHLNQITNYASLIRNFSNDEFQFDTFYGYLIGESLEPTDLRFKDGDFIEAYKFDYVFRPSKKIPGAFGRRDGSLYTEVLKYSSLLERAIHRNKVFIEKLTARLS